MIKVKLVYRNYKPLHEAYASMVANPPKGVAYIVPAANPALKRFHKVYRKIRFAGAAKPLIRAAERFLFVKKAEDEADLYQYLNIISPRSPVKPYIVDTEHAAGLIGFTSDNKRLRAARDFLRAPECKAVTCWSEAAARTLSQLMAEDYVAIKNKVHVVYPAVAKTSGMEPDYEYMDPKNPAIKLLLVGNQAYLKGTEELLAAVAKINQKYGSEKLELHIISNDAGELVRRYALPNVKLYPPVYDKQTVMKKFYLPADIFIMPTKQETFGMAVLDALAAGTAVITTDQFAGRELVEDGHDGILLKLKNPVMDTYFVPGKAEMDSVTRANLDPELSGQIYQVLAKVLDGKIDFRKMGSNGRQKFRPGQKFSIDTRKRKLEEIYRQALGGAA